jgi:hypothetical protein
MKNKRDRDNSKRTIDVSKRRAIDVAKKKIDAKKNIGVNKINLNLATHPIQMILKMGALDA